MISKSGCLTIFIVVYYLACVGVFSLNSWKFTARPLPRRCYLRYCRTRCPISGYDIDQRTGCPTCRCQNPCDRIKCGFGYTCQTEVVSRRCFSGVCLGKEGKCVPATKPGEVENICQAGSPNGYCFGNVTPLTNCVGDYKCIIHPNNNYGLCCLKASASTFSNLPICEQPKKIGPCRARKPRYFYNSTSGQCEQFGYGGCQGNSNNFENKKECEETCRNYCSMPAEIGFCFAKMTRFYFDQRSGSCRTFHYGGCGGNGNNFYTEKDCLNYCHSRRSGYKSLP